MSASRRQERPHSETGAGRESRTGRRRLRKWLAGASLAIPAALIVLTALLWCEGLPSEVAFHWDASGRPDGTFPTAPLFWMTLGGAAVLLILGAVVLLMPSSDSDDTRKAMAVLGVVAAFCAAAWIVPAGVTFSDSGAELGGWLIIFGAALVYGFVPMYLTPRSS